MNNLYLQHHGIKGQKWGRRRFQNVDGSYTSSGKTRYGIGDGKTNNGDNKKKMSTAKKVAIGVGVAATVAGSIYVANRANKILTKSLSERTSELGKSMVTQSHTMDMKASEIMNWADRSKLSGNHEAARLERVKATRMFDQAEKMRREGFGNMIKARNKNFSKKELIGEAKQLRKDIKDTKNTNLKYFRRAADMYDDFGRPNYDKKTMRSYEAWARRNARVATKKHYSHLL